MQLSIINVSCLYGNLSIISVGYLKEHGRSQQRPLTIVTFWSCLLSSYCIKYFFYLVGSPRWWIFQVILFRVFCDVGQTRFCVFFLSQRSANRFSYFLISIGLTVPQSLLTLTNENGFLSNTTLSSVTRWKC